MFYLAHDILTDDIKHAMKSQLISYRNLSIATKIPHSSLWRMIEKPFIMDMGDFIRITNALKLNPYRYFEEKEVKFGMFLHEK